MTDYIYSAISTRLAAPRDLPTMQPDYDYSRKLNNNMDRSIPGADRSESSFI